VLHATATHTRGACACQNHANTTQPTHTLQTHTGPAAAPRAHQCSASSMALSALALSSALSLAATFSSRSVLRME
jgi:hypothetical protein